MLYGEQVKLDYMWIGGDLVATKDGHYGIYQNGEISGVNKIDDPPPVPTGSDNPRHWSEWAYSVREAINSPFK